MAHEMTIEAVFNSLVRHTAVGTVDEVRTDVEVLRTLCTLEQLGDLLVKAENKACEYYAHSEARKASSLYNHRYWLIYWNAYWGCRVELGIVGFDEEPFVEELDWGTA